MDGAGRTLDFVRFCIAVGLLVASTALAPTPSGANWDPFPGGVPVCTAAGPQLAPVTVPSDPGVIAIWEDHRGALSAIYAQRLDASGGTSWTTGGVAVAAASANQIAPIAVPDQAGGAIIVWQQSATFGQALFAQRLSPAGLPLWGPSGIPICPVSSDQEDPAVAGDSAGGVVVVWEDRRSGSAWNVFAQRLDASGRLLWTSDGVAVCDAAADQLFPTVCPDGLGGAIAFWEDERSGDPEIYGQRIAGDGRLLWDSAGVLAAATYLATGVTCAADLSGGAVLAWADFRDYSSFDVYAQRLHSDGSLAWGPSGVPVCRAEREQRFPVIAPDATGGAVIAWEDERHDGGYYTNSDIYAQRIFRDGTPLWATNGQAVCAAPGNQSGTRLQTTAAGEACVTWQDQRSGSTDVYAQGFGPGGGAAWPLNGLRLSDSNGSHNHPAIAWASGWNATAAWEDSPLSGPADVYAQQGTVSDVTVLLTPSGFSGPLVARNAPDATPAGVAVSGTLAGNGATYLNWSVSQTGPNLVGPWQVQVRADDDPYAPLASVAYRDSSPISAYSRLNVGPVMVRGGRHTLSLVADPAGQLLQRRLDNDTLRIQWVWSPLALGRDTVVVRGAPPDPGPFPQPNADGFMFTRRDTTVAWVASTAPLSALEPYDNYDLYVYDDYSGSQNGYSHLLARSTTRLHGTDFVVGASTSTPAVLYPALVRAGSVASSSAVMDWTDAAGRRSSSSSAQWTNQVLHAFHLADVYEAYLQAGQAYEFRLDALTSPGATAPDSMLMEVFPPQPGTLWTRGQGVASAQQGGEPVGSGAVPESLVYVCTTTGWHPVVVYRDNGSDVARDVAYTFGWQPTTATADAAPAGPPALALEAPAPNPMQDHCTFSFSLPRPAVVRLALFDVHGRRRDVVAAGVYGAGRHSLSWNRGAPGVGRLSSGIYWAVLDVGRERQVRRMVVLR